MFQFDSDLFQMEYVSWIEWIVSMISANLETQRSMHTKVDPECDQPPVTEFVHSWLWIRLISRQILRIHSDMFQMEDIGHT